MIPPTLPSPSHFSLPDTADIIVAGGGIAGSFFAGVMGRAGAKVLLVEKEARFRDRVRGETLFPWGVAEIVRLGVRDVLDQAGAVEIVGLREYANRQPLEPYLWAADSIDGLPMIGFEHVRLQEAAFAWASAQGASVIRPAKVAEVEHRNGTQRVRVQTAGGETVVRARLVVGADGKNGASRRWTGGTTRSDQNNHQLGGVLVAGVKWPVRYVDMYSDATRVSYWIPVSSDHTRIFLALTKERQATSGVVGSFGHFISVVGEQAPEGMLTAATQVGPLGFFPNQCTWATRISASGVTLIGDAAGSLDPTQGHGNSLALRDVRVLSDLLLAESVWQTAIEAYARQRTATYDVLRAHDRWMVSMRPTDDPEASLLREGHNRAIEADPALGGWRMLSSRGPDGLVANGAAHRHFIGADME